MFIKQLSIFLENREGRLGEVLKVLKNNNIDILSMSLADTSDYGMLRLIVDKPQEAKDVLRESGFSAKLTDVIAVKINHHVGSLQEILEEICKAGVNVEYLYALTTDSKDASIVIKTSEADKVSQIIETTELEYIDSDLFQN